MVRVIFRNSKLKTDIHRGPGLVYSGTSSMGSPLNLSTGHFIKKAEKNTSRALIPIGQAKSAGANSKTKNTK